MNKRTPAEVFPPGDFLNEELEARGWTQSDLASILDRPVRLVNEIIAGKRGITPETATGLAEAFGTTPDVWLSLEATWQLSKVRPKMNTVSRRASLYSKAPIKEMTRRQWITDSSDVDVLENQVLNFFGIEHLDEELTFAPHAARKSTPYRQPGLPGQAAWLCRARQLANGLQVGSFSEDRFQQALQKLKLLMRSPEEARHVPRILAEAGVRFLVIEPLAGNKVDGVTFWLDKHSPVIALSLRYDRIDWFWFTIGHECGHISQRNGLADLQPVVDADIVGEQQNADEDKPESEKRADSFASDFLIPSDRLQNFIDRTGPIYFKGKIIGFAATLGVHPGIVVGQLQHRGEIGFSANRDTLVHIRQFVTESALTDGWGHTVSI